MKNVRKIVEKQVAKGISSSEILASFKEEEEKEEAEYWIKNIASLDKRKRYYLLNTLLIAALGFVTLKKLVDIYLLNYVNLLLLFSLVVPVINIYLIKEIVFFRRTGYQMLGILAIISLLNQENRMMPEVIIMPAISLISFFLYYKMFKQDVSA